MSEETSTQVETSTSEETSNHIEGSEEVVQEIEAMEAVVQEEEVVDMSASEESEEVTAEGEEPSDSEVEQAAEKVDAKEVKGSEGDLYKIKVDGQELEVGKDELVRLAQMGKSGQRAMQEKAELQKSIASFVEALKENPESVLSEDLGVDVKELAQKILSKQLEEEALSPSERRAREAEAKLEKLMRDQEDKEKSRQEQEYAAEVAKYEAELEVQVQDAFEDSGLPKKPIFLHRMADLLEEALTRKLDISPKQVAKIIKEDWLNQTKDALSAFDDDALEEMLGKEIVGRVRKNSLKKVKKVPGVNSLSTAASVKPPAPVAKAPGMSIKDFLKTNISKS